MRTLERNKITFWCVNAGTETEELDEEGFNTGNLIVGYGTPYQIKIAVAPTNGELMKTIFGEYQNCDKIAVSEKDLLKKGDLLFLTQPTSNYETTYEYSVGLKQSGLNSFYYGLVGRVK